MLILLEGRLHEVFPALDFSGKFIALFISKTETEKNACRSATGVYHIKKF